MGCSGCPGNTQTINTGRTYVSGGPVQVLSHGTCEGITIDLLNMYKRLVDCVISHSLYTQVSVSQAEINQAKALLITWISAKEIDPASCEHQEKLPLLQLIINKIVAFGQC